MATIGEIDAAVRTARANGARDLVLLKCTSTYPASPESSNIATIPHLRTAFGAEVGLSDHTAGIGAAVASVALGASVIEKHFTLRRADGGVDAAFSIEPLELEALVRETDRAWRAIGSVVYGGTAEEAASRRFRRSLYVSAPVTAGERITRENVRVVRPGFGLAPDEIERVLGRTALVDLAPGTPLCWELLR
jgi:N-acetylneuraminate synthase